ncbi:MAG: type II toxin-antitoxin system RelE/ParE family toxin [Phycisphaerae bacterium]
MNYTIFITRTATKNLNNFNQRDYLRIKRTLLALSDNPRSTGSKKLINRPGWRIRVGKFRIIYEIDDSQKEIVILDIDHRKDIYR